MKYFLIIILSVSTFCAKAQVNLPDSIARWYLQQAELVMLQGVQLQTKQDVIDALNAVIVTDGKIIQSFKEENIYQKEMIAIYEDWMAHKNDQLESAEKALNNAKALTLTVTGAALGGIIGTIIGQPLIGTAIGAGVGYIVGKIKYRKRR